MKGEPFGDKSNLMAHVDESRPLCLMLVCVAHLCNKFLCLTSIDIETAGSSCEIS